MIIKKLIFYLNILSHSSQYRMVPPNIIHSNLREKNIGIESPINFDTVRRSSSLMVCRPNLPLKSTWTNVGTVHEQWNSFPVAQIIGGRVAPNSEFDASTKIQLVRTGYRFLHTWAVIRDGVELRKWLLRINVQHRT